MLNLPEKNRINRRCETKAWNMFSDGIMIAKKDAQAHGGGVIILGLTRGSGKS